MFNPCETCKSGFPIKVCSQFCRSYKYAVAERGRKTAYQQRIDAVMKAVRKK